MALPLPELPITIPTYSQDRGPVKIDPVTKSTLQEPASYKKEDVCGREAYTSLGTSLSVNQLSEDCQTVLAASGSLQVTIPWSATATVAQAQAAITAIVNRLESELLTAAVDYYQA